jgi:hypothetical protein
LWRWRSMAAPASIVMGWGGEGAYDP